ncbi:MAG: hypothetical protein ACTSRU_14405 [Candidatus Hodarchaeales archaeon]
MAKLLKWDDETGANNSSGNQREYLRIEPNIEYRLRPMEYPVEFDRFYNRDTEGKLHSAIAGPKDECPIRNKYSLDPSTRYAMNMIDRSDKKLKIVEFPFTVFQELKKWKKFTQQEPGGKSGTDFIIKKTGSGQKNTRWFCEPVQDVLTTPWTTEDQESVKAAGGYYNLREIYAATPADKIEERLGFVASSTPAVTEAKVDSVNTIENDMNVGGVAPDFGDGNTVGEEVTSMEF